MKRVADYDRANPHKSTREAGEALGISKSAVDRARKSIVPGGTIEDERPTIDKPPAGAPWDDQDDRDPEDDEVENIAA